MNNESTRREFLKYSGFVASGIAAGTVLSAVAASAASSTAPGVQPSLESAQQALGVGLKRLETSGIPEDATVLRFTIDFNPKTGLVAKPMVCHCATRVISGEDPFAGLVSSKAARKPISLTALWVVRDAADSMLRHHIASWKPTDGHTLRWFTQCESSFLRDDVA